MLIPVMTVAENIVLAQEPRTAGVFLDYDAAIRRVRDLAATFNFAIDPDAKVESITVGQQQRVEILKALFRGADILILDEPTAVLTPRKPTSSSPSSDAAQREGMSIISSVTSFCRSWRSPSASPSSDAARKSTRFLAKEQSARTCALDGRPRSPAQGREAAGRSRRAPSPRRELQVLDDRDLEAVRGVSLDVRAREIVAVAGVDGNGQSGAHRRPLRPPQDERRQHPDRRP